MFSIEPIDTVTLTFELTVTEGDQSATDTVDIVVEPATAGGPIVIEGGCGCVLANTKDGQHQPRWPAGLAAMTLLGLALRRRRRQ